jgi:putative transposase
MPWKNATKIKLSENERRLLTGYATGTHTPLHIKIRAQIVLHAANGWGNNAIERTMLLDPTTVKRWRDRYSSQHEELKRAEAETPLKMRGMIVKILSDEQRPGSPPTYTDEQIAALIALACEDPQRLGLPFSHWTPGLLPKEAVKRNIAEGISVRQIGRYLKRKGLTTA